MILKLIFHIMIKIYGTLQKNKLLFILNWYRKAESLFYKLKCLKTEMNNSNWSYNNEYIKTKH